MPFIKKAVPVFAILIGFILIYSCSASKKTIIIAPPPIVKDLDKDGVTDELDRCPDVAGLASLHGCPDRDGDGIADAEDRCPAVAGLARYQGCPIPDTDGDGINDEEDKCIGYKGPPSNFGCPVISEQNVIKTIDTVIYVPQPRPEPAGNHHTGSSDTNTGVEPAPETKPAGQLPEASIVYSFKRVMNIGDEQEIRMVIQLGKSADLLKQDLLERLNDEEREAKLSRSDDTSIVKKFRMAGYKYFKVIADYDKKIFSVKARTDSIQPLDSLNPTTWLWKVTALKANDGLSTKSIKLVVTGMNEKEDTKGKVDLGELPIMVLVQKKPFPLAWAIAGILFILLLAALFIWLRASHKARNKQIFFSYNWHQEPLKIIVDEMYSSLKRAGFNVVKDKEDLHYGGSISRFMNDLGRSKLVIVAVSEKYLKSVNCMKELFHIYSNAGMNKNEFQKRIFPVTTEQLNLSNLDVVKSYEEHWIAEEQKWENYTREHSNSVTKEEAEEYEFTRRVNGEITNILSYLYDINAMNIDALKQNDFEMVKNAIRDALEGKK